MFKALNLKASFPQKNIFQIILANIVLSLILIIVFVDGAFSDLQTFFVGFAWAFSVCITQWLGHGYIFDYMDKKIDWIETPVKRAVWGLVALVLYSIVAFVIIQVLFYYLVYGKSPIVTWGWVLGYIFTPVAISFAITLTLTTIGFFKAWKESVVRAEQLNNEMLAYKYETLRNQINPHFLFNSFNVLSDLVYDDQKAAVKFINQMSDLFRYVLDSRDKELVPLQDEIRFIRSYAFLLTTRFENKLNIDFQLEADEDEYIVPVSLQMLIENAVKHNEISEAYPLAIRISKVKDYIIVANSLKFKDVHEEKGATGINNLQQQFAFFTDLPILIDNSANNYVVKLPILKSLKQ
jgi:sensor histidine kinase YesM